MASATLEDPPRSRFRLVRRQPALTVLCAGAALLLLVTGVWVYTLNSRLGDVPRFDPGLERPDRPQRVEGEAMNVLLLGVDDGKGRDLRRQLQSGDWEPGSFRSDTMMVWHLSADRRTSQIVSFPRDSWVPIPGHGEAKLNAAFSFGGPRLLVRTIEDLLGIYIDHVAILDFEGFSDLTETLGGVRIERPDGTTQTLAGREALDYVRERYSLPAGDFDRIRRQQDFLRALMKQLLDGSNRTNPVRITRLAGDLSELLVLDEQFDNGLLRSLALTFGRHGAGRITWLTAPTDGTGRSADGQSIVNLDVAASRELVQAISWDEFDAYNETHDIDRLPPPGSIN